MDLVNVTFISSAFQTERREEEKISPRQSFPYQNRNIPIKWKGSKLHIESSFGVVGELGSGLQGGRDEGILDLWSTSKYIKQCDTYRLNRLCWDKRT